MLSFDYVGEKIKEIRNINEELYIQMDEHLLTIFKYKLGENGVKVRNVENNVIRIQNCRSVSAKIAYIRFHIIFLILDETWRIPFFEAFFVSPILH